MIKRVTIFGERCSGTNYLEQLLIANFDVEVVFDFGWKHFFGFSELLLNRENTQSVLFIGIIRNRNDWINSLYREKHHLTRTLTANIHNFLTCEFYSVFDNNNEIMEDRHIFTGERYKNIFEMRNIKNKFLVENMPKMVDNYMLITYDKLISQFEQSMNEFAKYLPVKSNIEFPINITYNSINPQIQYKKKTHKRIRDTKILKYMNMSQSIDSVDFEDVLFGQSVILQN